jgi:hypothetical protein
MIGGVVIHFVQRHGEDRNGSAAGLFDLDERYRKRSEVAIR